MSADTLVGREREIETLARTVECPVCLAQPGKPCRVLSLKTYRPHQVAVSHIGRLKVARGGPL